jgi:hypothetical protein
MSIGQVVLEALLDGHVAEKLVVGRNLREIAKPLIEVRNVDVDVLHGNAEGAETPADVSYPWDVGDGIPGEVTLGLTVLGGAVVECKELGQGVGESSFDLGTHESADAVLRSLQQP